MANTIELLHRKGLINPPKWLPNSIHFLSIMGSVSYGVSDDTSDMDLYGWCVPPRDIVFPHLAGHIQGFGRQQKRFDQYQQHHIESDTDGATKTYDLQVYNVVKYFQLCMDNNPNMLDSLFAPRICIQHMTQSGEMVREKRHIFLHKGCWPKFKGYSFSQLHKMKGKSPEAGSKRQAVREKYGYDVKFAYHVVRLLSEVEQILTTGDLDLQEKGRREHMKAIRRGEVSEDDVISWAASKEKALETIYEQSKLPWGPREDEIKQLLLNTLESTYGSLEKAVVREGEITVAMRKIKEITDGIRL